MTAAEEFVVVIDAGHGGKDPGAQSANRKINEKDIALKVALRAGELIRNAHPDVTVKYTRRTDVFVELKERARIANKAKADLFISVHCNAAEGRKAHGAEVFVLGSEEGRTQANLNVAKRENNVILLEKDYKESYQGFDPSSAESYIIFEYLQGEYLKESIALAQCVQKELCTTGKRYDRGVHQAGFLVLHATAMPSILVELGFISNAEEEKFLNSADGKEKLSKSIANGFDSYYKSLKKDKQTAEKDKQESTKATSQPAPKAEQTEKSSNQAQPKQEAVKQEQGKQEQGKQEPAKQQPQQQAADAIVFKVQFLTSSTKLLRLSRKCSPIYCRTPVIRWDSSLFCASAFRISTRRSSSARKWPPPTRMPFSSPSGTVSASTPPTPSTSTNPFTHETRERDSSGYHLPAHVSAAHWWYQFPEGTRPILIQQDLFRSLSRCDGTLP